MNNDPIIIERIFNAPIEKVWSAITNKEEMKNWYFDLKEFKPETGFEFQFWGGTEKNKYLHICKITEVIVNNKITYSWRYEGYEGISFVTFQLQADGTKTKLKLIHEGLESFPSNNPDFAKTNFVEGWTHIVNSELRNYLEK